VLGGRLGAAGQAQEDGATTRAIKDDESESDETLSLSYHTTKILLLTMLRARTTRQLVLLHACTQLSPGHDGSGPPSVLASIPRSAALCSSFTRNTRIY
jgi:hypothetical protein